MHCSPGDLTHVINQPICQTPNQVPLFEHFVLSFFLSVCGVMCMWESVCALVCDRECVCALFTWRFDSVINQPICQTPNQVPLSLAARTAPETVNPHPLLLLRRRGVGSLRMTVGTTRVGRLRNSRMMSELSMYCGIDWLNLEFEISKLRQLYLHMYSNTSDQTSKSNK